MLNEHFLVVLSSPSGGGKTTLCRMLQERLSGLVYSVSATTRPQRQGETDGKDYFFLSREEFTRKDSQGYFAETAVVHDFMYGTPFSFIKKALAEGNDILMDIDVQGAMSIMKHFEDSVTIFIMPPSLEILKMRLAKRATDTDETIAVRLKNAETELKCADKFKYQVINENIEETYSRISEIIEKERKIRRHKDGCNTY